jgi:uncharacterized protein
MLRGPMDQWWLVVCLAIFLIGVTKSGFGSGMGLMVVPLTAIAMGHIPGRGAEAALGLLLPLLIIGDLIAVGQYRRLFALRPAPLPALVPVGAGAAAAVQPTDPPDDGRQTALRLLRRLLPGTAVGVLLGGLLLWWFHQQKELVGALMRIEIGIESILLVGLHWWRQHRGTQTQLLPEPIRSHLTGAFAGISSTLAHAAGPIIAMYLLPLKLDRRLFVALCAIYFFILNTAKLPAYWLSGQFEKAELSFTIQLLPLVAAGALFGFWINRRMNDVLFTRIVYLLTFAMGWYILVEGTLTLLRRWA